ncbi:OmpA family protein [bacterium]|nr:OmpA family protein [bacterium]
MKKILITVIIFISFIFNAKAAEVFDVKVHKDVKSEFNSINTSDDFFYHEVPRGIVLSVSDDILFKNNESDELTLNPQAYTILDKISEILMKITNDCTIEGYSDRILSAQENLDLSIIKADLVADYILRKTPKLHDRIFSVGFGNAVPFSSEVKSYQGKKLDNRINFVIIQYDATR